MRGKVARDSWKTVTHFIMQWDFIGYSQDIRVENPWFCLRVMHSSHTMRYCTWDQLAQWCSKKLEFGGFIIACCHLKELTAVSQSPILIIYPYFNKQEGLPWSNQNRRHTNPLIIATFTLIGHLISCCLNTKIHVRTHPVLEKNRNREL